MPYATFSTPVHAPVEILWALLMEKIENPGRFITAVENAKIIERRGGRVLREMRVKGEGDVLREWITHDDASLQVVFELVDEFKVRLRRRFPSMQQVHLTEVAPGST